jgi:hypothetical protein
MKFKTGLLFLSFFLSFWGFSQTVHVTGKIIDKEKKAYPDLKVILDPTEDSLVVFTNKKGEFEFDARPGNHTLKIDLGTNPDIRMVAFPEAAEFRLKTMEVNETYITEVVVGEKGFELEPIRAPALTNLPGSGGVERVITLTQVGASSSNELTSNYNVRGGNYDENLVYVNGFLVNRPFLTRSGQQEGMSFINSLLVQDISFSAGGFQALYGDKLSSVLDIRYKRPDSLHATVLLGALGMEAQYEDKFGERFRVLFGTRYRANGYLLNSLPTKGNYNPVFWDAQFLTTYDITEKWQWSVLGHLSSNRFKFAPQTQQTDFGTSSEAFSFNIYFDGQEDTRFLTSTVGTSLSYGGKKYQGTTYFTTFNSNESENFDIQGQYYINELETDPSKEEYGDSIAVLGVGTFLNHARNELNATIFTVYHDANFTLKEYARGSDHQNILKVGAGVQLEDFTDVISEWRMIDSAGYSLPQGSNDDVVQLMEVIKSNLAIENQRSYAYAQEHLEWRFRKDSVKVAKYAFSNKLGKDTLVADSVIRNALGVLQLDFGTRAVYTSFNDEFFVSPRMGLSYIPVRYAYHNGKFIRRSMKLRLAAGVYNQPPFYREYRKYDGTLNPEVRSQKSAHFITGLDYSFYMWNRELPFKFTVEGYYKYLWDINPYEIENVRIRYYADNIAKGYATGLDMILNGEFVPGLLSFFKVSILSTKEDILNDQYTNYYNAAGEVIIDGVSDDQVAVDSAVVYPGYIRRPSDQRLNIGVFFQDKMPGFERLTAQLGLNYGSRLPYGPPDFTRYKDTLTMKAYFRVDLGLSYNLLAVGKPNKYKWQDKLSECMVSLEVWNLLGYNNVLSKQWIQDVSGKYYSIPNYLTSRRFNLKLLIRF